MASEEIRKVFINTVTEYIEQNIHSLTIQNCNGCKYIGITETTEDLNDFQNYFKPDSHYWCALASDEDKIDMFFDKAMQMINKTHVVKDFLDKTNTHPLCYRLQFVITYLHEFDEKSLLSKDIRDSVLAFFAV